MKRETTFLKVVVLLLALPVLALCIFILPDIAAFFVELNPEFSALRYPFLIGLYVTAFTFFFALYQTVRLLNAIDRNLVFSSVAVDPLKKIKYCALVIGGLYVLFMPLLYLMGEKDDAPGIILIGLIVLFGSAIVAVFAAVLQKLLQNAIDIKSENDLTV
ncbi:DUF2975 domain-containing protein [Exiguobacterium flavidum]|uniref:DUF2975 domain-containing protein n=1 Tax=Exiguobacterium flavidum TaxID=2184695 RepID=UPI000DF76735|nr:DUF2975 domain-containing protein [Exiguobacterium flavidum]